jgi:Uma2 family endonuclease
METRTLISVQEYLSTAYSPDCDYVDGEVQERNLGEWDHSSAQTLLAAYFVARRKQWGIKVVTEQRVQVSPTRYRIPDVCVVLGGPDGQILRKPPFLCIEVLSPDDRMSRMRDRVEDYLTMGVPHVWVLDPGAKAAYQITSAEGWREVKDGVLRTQSPTFEVPLGEIFE